MLDTIRMKIDLSPYQYQSAITQCQGVDRWSWLRFKQDTGEIEVSRYSSDLPPEESWYRGLNICFRAGEHGKGAAVIECSVPKVMVGQNIELQRFWHHGLASIGAKINTAIPGLEDSLLPPPEDWSVLRADLGYNWKLDTEHQARTLIDAIKRSTFKFKRKICYETSVVYPGKNFSAKFYLKLPEFLCHDYRALVRAGCPEDELDRLEKLATGMLRFEFTGRTRWLRGFGIETIADLVSKQDALMAIVMGRVKASDIADLSEEIVLQYLRSCFKPSKATRILNFLRVAETHGLERLKTEYSSSAYYRLLAECTEAGIPPGTVLRGSDLPPVLPEGFKLKFPSSYAVWSS